MNLKIFCLSLVTTSLGILPAMAASARPVEPEGQRLDLVRFEISIEQVVLKMADFKNRIKSLRIEYAETLEDLYPDGDAAGHVNSADYLVKFEFHQNHVYHYLNTIADEDGPLEQDPPFKFTNDVERVVFFPDRRLAAVTKNPYREAMKATTAIERRPHYFEAIAFWPFETVDPIVRGLFLPESIRPSDYRIRPEPEAVDGVPCLVIESTNRDRIWVDPSKSFVLRRRLWRGRLGDGGEAEFDFRLADFREAAAGLWFPWRVVRTIRRIVADGEHRQRPDSVGQISVNNLVLNGVDGTAVYPPYPPGTIIRDEDTMKEVILPGGEEMLPRLIKRVARRYSLPRDEISKGADGFSARQALVPALVFAGILSFAFRKQ